MVNKIYKFKESLQEGIILSRPNRFTMQVKINNKIISCYCPSTSRIGNIYFNQIPCLISKNNNKKIKLRYTVEAISLDRINNLKKEWIGINQTKVNTYIKFFLETNQLSEIVNNIINIKRDVKFGKSKFDFLVDNHFLEIKTFLTILPKGKIPQIRNNSLFNAYDRIIQQYKDLIKAKKNNYNTSIIFCYIYSAKPQRSPIFNYYSELMKKQVFEALDTNINHWQVNLKITNKDVKLINYFPIKGL